MALRDYADYAENKVFQERVKVAMFEAAVAVMAEDPGTANHAERVVYAESILDGSASEELMAYGVVTNSTIQTLIDSGDIVLESSDDDIEFVVNSLFNAYAGVST